MRYFKTPLIVTGIVLALALVVGIAAVTWIHNSEIPGYEKTQRAQNFGAGVAMTTCLVISPFWLIAAGKMGKERRMAREKAQVRKKR